ncbi:Holliday junction ATP-dependent DNA helicase RuvA [Bryobacterales bacterium F-183]|nr:Holliday junction ATP-dependent DNA helicase RuvA [Bryobacterales bacterium F-183]
MIAFLRGVLLEKHPNQVIVDVGGVGYDVTIPVSTFTALSGPGTEAQLRVHTHVREDAISLFGFATQNEKLMFEKLTGVSGIGPKLAITILSGLPIGDLVGAIRGNQLEVLVKIPGVGKKTAERVVLELKDKLELLAALAPASASGSASPGKKPSFSAVEEDVLSALVNFGSPRPNAESAVIKARAEAGTEADFETLFRLALKLVR